MATRYWLGAAVAIPEQIEFEVDGDWDTGDTVWIEINGKRLTATLGTDLTNDNVCDIIANMINGDAALGDETRSALGSTIGEFVGLTATVPSTNYTGTGVTACTFTLTGPANGRPIGTVTVGETASGTSSGGFTRPTTNDIAAESPNHWDVVDNWSAGTKPVNGDTVIFDHQAAASCLYDLTQTSLTVASFKVTNGFGFSIGLPEINKDNSSYPYDEHQPTYLALAAATVLDIDSSGGGIVKIDCASTDTTTTVRGSGATAETNVPPVLLKINNASADLYVLGGSVGVGFEPGTAGELATYTCGGTSNPSLTLGDTMTLATGTVTSGKVVSNSAITTLTLEGGEHEQRSGALTTLSVNGGTYWDMSGSTITTVNMNGGRYDHTKDNRTTTITNFNVYSKCSIKDPAGAITASNGFDIYPSLKEITLEFPKRKTYTISAI